MRCQVRIDLLPVIRLLSDFLAVTANRQQTRQRPSLAKRRLELGNASCETALEVHHSLTHADARLEFHRIERLRDVIVGTGGEALRQILLISTRSQKDDVYELKARRSAQAPADLDSFEAGHHPVQHSQLGSAFSLQGFKNLPGCAAVSRGNDVPAETLQSDGQYLPRHGIIFGNQNLHFFGLL